MSAPLVTRRGHDHVPERPDTAPHVEHEFCPAQPNALRAILSCLPSRRRRVRVGPHAKPLGRTRPIKNRLELWCNPRLDRKQRSPVHRSVAAVDRYRVALAYDGAARQGALRPSVVYAHAGRAHDARLAHAAGHDGCVRGLAAPARQYADRLVECGHVFGLCLVSHEYDGLALAAHLCGPARVEHGNARSGSRRSGDPLHGGFLPRCRLWIQCGMQELYELVDF